MHYSLFRASLVVAIVAAALVTVWRPGAPGTAVALAAPAVDASSSAAGADASSLTFSHTVGSGSQRLLIVGVSLTGEASVSGVAYGGAPLVPLGSAVNGPDARVEMWALVAPATGTADVTVTLSQQAKVIAGAASFTGVDQSASTGTFTTASGIGSGASVTVTGTTAGQVVVDVLAVKGAISATAGPEQTQRWNAAFASDVQTAASTEEAAGAVATMSWSLAAETPWALGAVTLNAAPDVDTMPPGNVATYPKAGTVTATTADVLARLNEAGTAYFVVVDFGAVAPSAAQVKAGQDSTGAPVADGRKGSIALAADTEGSGTASGLTASTTYDVYVVAEDASGNLQASPVRVAVTPAGGASTPPPPAAASSSVPAAAGNFVGGASASTNSSSLTISKPVGTTTGHVMLAQVTVDGGSGVTITPASGWTLVIRTDNGTDVGSAIYRKVAGASEPSSYAFTYSPTNKRASGGIVVYSGVDTASPIDASGGQANSASSTITAPSVTTTATDALLVGFFAIRGNTAVTPPAGMTERYDRSSTGSGANTSEAADAVQTGAGASGTKAATASASGASVGQLVALKAAAPAPDTTPPANAAGYPKGGLVTSSLAELLVKTTEAGTAYFVVLADGATAPSAAQVKAGQDSTGTVVASNRKGSMTLTANAEVSGTVTELSPTTAYDIWVVSEDTLGNLQTSASKVDVTTGQASTPGHADCENADVKSIAGTVDVVFFTAPGGTFVGGVCIKAGTAMFAGSNPAGHSGRLGNGTYENGCYSVTGIGDGSVIVERIGTAGPSCQDLSHIDVYLTTAMRSVQFAASSSSGSESTTPANLSVVLSTASMQTVTVQYTVSFGTATGGGVDYTLAPSTLTFAPGETTKNIALTVVDDAIGEPDESVHVTLFSPENATLGSIVTHVYTIADNEGTPSVGFMTASSSGLETVTPVNLAVELSHASSQTVTVGYAATGGTATGGGVDYTLAGTLTFAPGETSKNIALAVVSDGLNEPDETVVVTLSNPSNATLNAATTHTYNILDADPPPAVGFATAASTGSESTTPALLVVQSGTSALTVTVDYAVTGGTATGGGVDYTLAAGTLTFAPGETSKSISLSVVNDAIAESDETVRVTLSNPTNSTLGSITTHTYSILDNEGQPSVTFTTSASSGPESTALRNMTVILSHPSSSTVTVGYSVVGGTATGGGVDYTLAAGALTFDPGETTKTVQLTCMDDALDEASETALVALSSPTNVELGAITVHTYTILDDDPQPTVSYTTAASTGGESTASATLTAQLSAVSGRTVLVSYAVSGGTARGGGVDYTLAAGLLVIPPGATTRTFGIAVVNDAVFEGDETVKVTLSNPVNATLGAISTHTYTILDNETEQLISVENVKVNGGTPLADDNRIHASAKNTGADVPIEVGQVSCPNGLLPMYVSAVVAAHDGQTHTLALQANNGKWTGIWKAPPGSAGAKSKVDIVAVCPQGEMWQEVGQIVLYDPSGIITDPIARCAVMGVRVELQRLVEGVWTVAPTGQGIIDPDMNPQFSGPDGSYGWDVVAGQWRIVVSANGYQTQTSRSVTIPPPVTDLHIDLVPTGAAGAGCMAQLWKDPPPLPPPQPPDPELEPIIVPPPAPPVSEPGGAQVPITNPVTAPVQPNKETEVTTTSSGGSSATVTVPPAALPSTVPAGTSVRVAAVSDPVALQQQAPPPPQAQAVVNFVVNLVDSGNKTLSSVNFEQPVALEFEIPASAAPQGATASEMVLAFWGGEGWVTVDSVVTVNADGSLSISASVDHFTLFAVFRQPGRGTFSSEPAAHGLSLALWQGGGYDALASAAGFGNSVWRFVDGWLVGYTVGAPDAVNAAFTAAFPQGLPAGTPVIISRRR